MFRSMISLVALSTVVVTAAAGGRRLGGTPSMATSSASASGPISFVMLSRVFVPYGMGDGYAFGMGAAEQIAYDHINKFAYAVSEQGYVNIIDYSDPATPVVMSSLAVDLAGQKLTDIEVCPDNKFFVVGASASDTVSDGTVMMFRTVQRSDSPNFATPALLRSIGVGPLPDMVLPNPDCSMIAVGNEGEGRVINDVLVDPEGSLDILKMTYANDDITTISSVERKRALIDLTDAQLKAKGVHLPLEQKAMEYWQVAAGMNFTHAINNYKASMNLEPEYLAWSKDGRKVYVNLQENNAIGIFAVAPDGTPTFSDVYGLGLKDHTTVGIDIIKDGAINITTYAGLKSLRMPDAIAVVELEGQMYILTANEGDDKEYGDFEEKQKLKSVLRASNSVQLNTATASAAAQAVADMVYPLEDSLRVTVGSTAVDYTTPATPVINEIVAMGGRGMSIYKDVGGALELHWDSGSDFETKVAEHYPWSFNSIQDEEFAPVGGVLYTSNTGLQETIDDMNDPDADGCADGGDGNPGACPLSRTVDDRSPKDGAGTEALVVGEACDRMMAVTATEKQGIAFVYDITNIATSDPALMFVTHLSPISQTKNVGLAYASRELGEVDPEGMVFLDAAHSPTGQAGVLFAGAWSGTMSFYGFECGTTSTVTTTTVEETVTNAALKAASVSTALLALVGLGVVV